MKELSEKATKVWVLALASVASFMISLDSQVVTRIGRNGGTNPNLHWRGHIASEDHGWL
jgi:hypothetical protein